jgi:hypothetical protein
MIYRRSVPNRKPITDIPTDTANAISSESTNDVRQEVQADERYELAESSKEMEAKIAAITTKK